MRTYPTLLTAFLLVPLAATSFAANVVIVEEIIAKVNGEVVTRSEYEQLIADIRAEADREKDWSAEQKTEYLEKREQNVLRDLIDRHLLVQVADELGVSVEAQVLRQRDEIMRQYKLATVAEFEQWVTDRTGMPVEDLMDQMRNNFLSQAVLGQEVTGRMVVPRAEIEKYFEEHQTEFVRSEGVRLSEILISTEGKAPEELPAVEKKAKEILARVQKGEPFAEIARRLSESSTSAENGGDIGIFRRGTLRKEIEDLVFDANKGFITDLIEVPSGYLILKVDERYREGQALLEEVEDEIRNRLLAPKYEPAIRAYLTRLREDAYIELRPGYVDAAAVAGKDTSWSDPAKLAPVTTTKEEVLQKKKKRRLLWLIPLPGGGGKDKSAEPEPAPEQPEETG